MLHVIPAGGRGSARERGREGRGGGGRYSDRRARDIRRGGDGGGASHRGKPINLKPLIDPEP